MGSGYKPKVDANPTDEVRYPVRTAPETRETRTPRRYTQVSDIGRRTKAKIRNGGDTIPHVVDGRTVLAKRHRQIISQLVADQGGPEHLSEIRYQLLLRFAGAALLAEQVEQKVLKEEPVQLDQYSMLISCLVRVASKVGLNRIPKNVTPNLRTYLENHRGEEPSDEDDREDQDD